LRFFLLGKILQVKKKLVQKGWGTFPKGETSCCNAVILSPSFSLVTCGEEGSRAYDPKSSQFRYSILHTLKVGKAGGVSIRGFFAAAGESGTLELLFDVEQAF
jgi:hypothetical protein